MSTGLKCHALVIGIDDYGGGISPLQSAVRDVTAIAEILQSEHKYSVTCLRDAEAVGSAVEKHLTETLPPQLSAESALLLYRSELRDRRWRAQYAATGGAEANHSVKVIPVHRMRRPNAST